MSLHLNFQALSHFRWGSSSHSWAIYMANTNGIIPIKKIEQKIMPSIEFFKIEDTFRDKAVVYKLEAY